MLTFDEDKNRISGCPIGVASFNRLEHQAFASSIIMLAQMQAVVRKGLVSSDQFEVFLAALSDRLMEGYQLITGTIDSWVDEVEEASGAANKRLARSRLTEHPINDPSVRDRVWQLTNGKCTYCDGAIYRDGQAPTNEARFVVEHVVPASAGGPDNLANYVPACMSCNSSKGDRHVLTLIRKMQKRQVELVVDNEPARRMQGDE